ncbi:MAG: hypothetical protein AAFX78_01770 [Cyanobacteria bacterium J06638_20]
MPQDDDSVYVDERSLDPFGAKVWEVVAQILDSQDRVTIKEVTDAFEAKGLQASESVVRERIAELTEGGYLSCLPGAGRRPSYYYFSDRYESTDDYPVRQVEYATPDDADALSCLLSVESEMVSEITVLREELRSREEALEELQEDIEALRRSVRVKMRLARSEEEGGK